jgi:hypothetical protein
MYYKLLGMAVWHGGKLLLRQKYGRQYVPKTLLAGAAVAAAGAARLFIARRNGSES